MDWCKLIALAEGIVICFLGLGFLYVHCRVDQLYEYIERERKRHSVDP